jgi:integrase
MSELMHQYNTTGIMDSTNLTVKDFLTQWLATVKNTLTPGAYERYESIIRVHLIPDFGDVLLNKLTPERIQNHYNQKLASGLSPLTVKYHHTVIHAAARDCGQKRAALSQCRGHGRQTKGNP